MTVSRVHLIWKILITVVCVTATEMALAQSGGPLKGSVERIKVHGKSLEGNLGNDSPDREVSIYLPPGYKKDNNIRYPVIYLLHGFTDNDAKWYGFEKHWINVTTIADKLFSEGKAKEMILVTPNAFTRFHGSMYSNSVTTGNWENYIANELVEYIDKHYRTLATAKSRGLAGHSMGGFGAFRIGQKNPDVFSSIYLLSPCCLLPGTIENKQAVADVETVKSISDFENSGFFAKALFASAAAWSPNPSLPPFYLDLPVKKGLLQPIILSKWSANSPLVTLDQHIAKVKQLKAIAFDAGNKDESIASTIKVLDSALNNYGVKHFYEEYEGDHVNRIAERITMKVLPFFSENLAHANQQK